MGLASWVERVVQTIEIALTGQSNFRLTFSDFAKDSQISNSVQARLVEDEVRGQLRTRFSIDFKWPVLVELRQPPPQGWRANFYNPEGNMGRYTMIDLRGLPAHQILITPGLARVRFAAILAHELTHAYQRERSILNTNQALREGMARWVEWHFLNRSKSPEAAKLLKLKTYTFGRSIETIVAYEKKHGLEKTLQWLNSIP